MSLSEDLGVRLRRIRENNNLSREQLAEMAHISPQYLAHLEIGTKNMSAPILYNLTRALNVSADYLLFGIAKEKADFNRDLACEAFASMLPNDQELAEKMLYQLLALVKKSNDDEIWKE